MFGMIVMLSILDKIFIHNPSLTLYPLYVYNKGI